METPKIILKKTYQYFVPIAILKHQPIRTGIKVTEDIVEGNDIKKV